MKSSIASALAAAAILAAAPAMAQQAQPYQIAIVPASSGSSSVVVLMNSSTGTAKYSMGDNPFSPIPDPAPGGASVYRIDAYATFDDKQNRSWDVFRTDVKTGRLWHLACCQTVGWNEIPDAK